MSLQISTFIFMEYIPRSRILGSRGICMFNFNGYCQFAFQKGWTLYNSNVWEHAFPPHPCWQQVKLFLSFCQFNGYKAIFHYEFAFPWFCTIACIVQFVYDLMWLKSSPKMDCKTKHLGFFQCRGRALTFPSLWEGAAGGLAWTPGNLSIFLYGSWIFGLVLLGIFSSYMLPIFLAHYLAFLPIYKSWNL